MNLTDYAMTNGGTAKIGCQVFADLAERAVCSPAVIYMIALGHKQPSAKLATRIELATGGAVSRRELRPDVFRPLSSEGQDEGVKHAA